MNKRKVVGYALIATPIVVGIVAGTMFLGPAFVKGMGIGFGVIVPIVVGCHLLGKG